MGAKQSASASDGASDGSSSGSDGSDNLDLRVTRKQADDAFYRIYFGRSAPRTYCQNCSFFTNICCSMFCWIFCCPPCPPCVIEKLAIGGPRSQCYDFVLREDGHYRMQLTEDAGRVLQYQYRHNPHLLSLLRRVIPLLRCFRLRCSSERKSGRLACVFYQLQSSPRPTVLLSHAKDQDLGLVIADIALLSDRLEVDVFAYDYSGYGLSDGCPSEKSLYENIELAYRFMTTHLGIPWRQIIAIGTSLGTGPTIHLASRFPVGAIVLQGAYLSAFRTCCGPKQNTCCLDRFVNFDRIRGVQCPTLFVHGENDSLFKAEHVLLLWERCPGAAGVQPLIIPGCGHLSFVQRSEYWERLRKFIYEDRNEPVYATGTQDAQVSAGTEESGTDSTSTY